MSLYAYDPQTLKLLVTWETGEGRKAEVVAGLPEGVSPEAAGRLTAALDELSSATWDTYLHQPEALGDPEEPNTDAWRWARERSAVDKVLKAVQEPNLPDEGMMLVSYVRVEEAGHQLGRVLHELEADLGHEAETAIYAEIQADQTGMLSAELGDLTGRAAQAVTLSRVGASPTQIEEAWAIMLADPLGCDQHLMTRFEPSAAAIAAARCLRCAAQITSTVSGVDPEMIVLEADNIQALPVATPTAVLELLEAGLPEREVVVSLLTQARAVAAGEIPDPDLLEGELSDVYSYDAEPGIPAPPRLTPLDPRRAAPDLLEDLCAGIWASFLLWCEYLPCEDDDEDVDDAHAEGAETMAAAQRDFSNELRTLMSATGSPV